MEMEICTLSMNFCVFPLFHTHPRRHTFYVWFQLQIFMNDDMITCFTKAIVYNCLKAIAQGIPLKRNNIWMKVIQLCKYLWGRLVRFLSRSNFSCKFLIGHRVCMNDGMITCFTKAIYNCLKAIAPKNSFFLCVSSFSYTF